MQNEWLNPEFLLLPRRQEQPKNDERHPEGVMRLTTVVTVCCIRKAPSALVFIPHNGTGGLTSPNGVSCAA